MFAKAGREPVERLPRCVKCAYSLKGLPAEHACPECGLRYDGHVWVYRPGPPPLWRLGLFVVHRLWVFGGAIFAVQWLTSFAVPRFWILAALGSLVVAAAWLSAKWIGEYREGLCIALLPDGILVKGSLVMVQPIDHIGALVPDHANGRFIPWSSITRASLGTTFDGALLDVESGDTPLRVQGFFATGAEMRQFVEEVEARRKVWQQRAGRETNPS